jgi:hypothetical protein
MAQRCIALQVKPLNKCTGRHSNEAAALPPCHHHGNRAPARNTGTKGSAAHKTPAPPDRVVGGCYGKQVVHCTYCPTEAVNAVRQERGSVERPDQLYVDQRNTQGICSLAPSTSGPTPSTPDAPEASVQSTHGRHCLTTHHGMRTRQLTAEGRDSQKHAFTHTQRHTL